MFLNVTVVTSRDIRWRYWVTWPLCHCKSTYRWATKKSLLAFILKTIINSGTGSVYNYLSERKKGWNQILFYDRNKLKPSRKFLFNTVDSKFSYCAYFKCHVTENDSSWSQVDCMSLERAVGENEKPESSKWNWKE